MKKKYIILILILTNLITFFYLQRYNKELNMQNTINENIFYNCYRVALEDHHSVIMEIEDTIVKIENGESFSLLNKKIDIWIKRLKASKVFMFKSWGLVSDFPGYYYFDIYLRDLSTTKIDISKQEINKLKKIIELQKKLIPKDKFEYGEIKEYYYDKLVTKNGKFNRDILDKNLENKKQLKVSANLKYILNEINKISKR